MGYYATGGGSVRLMQEVPEEVMDVIKETFSDFGVDGDELWVTFEDCKYHDDVYDCMKLLAPYAKSGDVCFAGEDDCHWRFFFFNGEVEEQSGAIVYQSNRPKRKFRVVFTRIDECTDEYDYCDDSVIIELDNQSPERMAASLLNEFAQYVEFNQIADVSVEKIYEEE